MSFKKGYTPWNKGKKCPEHSEKMKGRTAWNKGLTKETDERIAIYSQKGSKTKKGKPTWNKGLTKNKDYRLDYERPTAFKKGQVAYNKGVPLSEEQKQKLSESLKGRSAWNKGKQLTDEHKKKLSGIPRPRTEEQNKKLSATIQGVSLEEWQGYSSNERQKEWNSKEWQELRKKIMERDDYTCQECGDYNYKGRGKSIRLEVHHIKEWCNYPELRMDENNLVLLCVDCHNKTRKCVTTKLLTNEESICQV